MARRYEVRIAGIGGQGIILAGVILAEAAVSDGMNAVQSQSGVQMIQEFRLLGGSFQQYQPYIRH